MKYNEKKVLNKEGKEIVWKHPGGKLRRLGPSSLTDAELLTVILGSGISGRSAEDIATETSGLVRGSNIDSMVPKYLVIPEEREEQFKRKQKSPMFAERFEKDNWNLLFFDSIRHQYKKLKSKQITLDSIINKKGPAVMRPDKKNEQMNLF